MQSVRSHFMQKYLMYFKSTYFPQSNRHLCVKQWLKAHKDLLLKAFFILITTQDTTPVLETLHSCNLLSRLFIYKAHSRISLTTTTKSKTALRGLFRQAPHTFPALIICCRYSPIKLFGGLNQCNVTCWSRGESERDIACGGTSFCFLYKAHNACHLMYIS